MANNMNVSITLRLIDQFTSQTRAVRDSLQAITKSATDLQRAFTGSSSMGGAFAQMQSQARGLGQEVRNLTNQFSQLGRAQAGGGGSWTQRQVSDLRQMLTLQQQVIANNNRIATGPAGGGGRVMSRMPGGGGGTSWLGRSGFNPNASLIDRAQYRAVNEMERSFTQGIIQSDIARTRFRRLDLSPETIAEAERQATELNRYFQELTRSDILETFGEIVTQFRTDGEAFRFLPYLLRTQQLDIQAGRNRAGGRQGMMQLVRAVGLTGRLTDNEGNFTEGEASAVLDAYMRAREIGGVDINPSGFFQLVKYMKAAGQTLSVPAILESAIASPDVGHSTFGNQLAMMIRGMASGRATKEALEAQARWGLRTAVIDPNHPEGPHRLRAGALVDSVLQREHPMEWWRKHILGPEGALRRMGIDPIRSSPAAIADALAPMFSNVSHENIANMFSTQQGEWQNQIARALRLNRGRPMWETHDENGRPLPLNAAADRGLWTGLQRARAQVENAFTSIANNFEDILLPPLFKFAAVLNKVSEWTNPQTGNQFLRFGLLGGGAVGAWMLMRNLARGMGPMGRLLLGGTLGLGFGGVAEALTGAVLLRSLGGGAAAAAAGAAGAAVATGWRAGFMRVIFGIGRFLRSGLLVGLGISAVTSIIDNWETIAARLKAIWADLQQALPSFLGGGDKGMGAITQGQGLAQLRGDIRPYTQPVDDFLRGYAEQLAPQAQPMADYLSTLRAQRWAHGGDLVGVPSSATAGRPVPVTVVGKGTVQPINVTNNITVNVAQTNASPQAIGEAAGNAVASRMRGALYDLPAVHD